MYIPSKMATEALIGYKAFNIAVKLVTILRREIYARITDIDICAVGVLLLVRLYVTRKEVFISVASEVEVGEVKRMEAVVVGVIYVRHIAFFATADDVANKHIFAPATETRNRHVSTLEELLNVVETEVNHEIEVMNL